jgi:hypothetical protein
MEQKRRQYVTEQLRIDICRAEKAQDRDEEILKNIPSLNLGSELTSKKKDEIKNIIDRRRINLEEMRERSALVSSGKLDKELAEKAANESKIYHTKREVALKKKKDLIQEDDDKKEIMNRKPREKDTKYVEKDYNYFNKVFHSIGDSLPDYMRENLKGMPNNKGYIWRGCLFMGRLNPERGQPMVLFEKVRGGITRIHESDEYETKVFEKQGKEKKRLVSKKRRNNYSLGKNKF